MRKFLKISEPEFNKTMSAFLISQSKLTKKPQTSLASVSELNPDLAKLYRSFTLPSRSTVSAAGYDFFLLTNLCIPAGATVLVPTGIKATLPETEFLLLVLRSSSGIKHHLRLTNQVGIIDSDYYNNHENEGQIFYSLQNLGDKDQIFLAGDRLIQGIFLPFSKTDDDIPRSIHRTGKYKA